MAKNEEADLDFWVLNLLRILTFILPLFSLAIASTFIFLYILAPYDEVVNWSFTAIIGFPGSFLALLASYKLFYPELQHYKKEKSSEYLNPRNARFASILGGLSIGPLSFFLVFLLIIQVFKYL